MKNSNVLYLLLAGLVLLSLYFWRYFKKSLPSQRVNQEDLKEKIRLSLEGTGYVLLSRYVVAHAQVETNDFKDPKTWKLNNLFGMKIPANRNTLASGLDGPYASFDSPEDSVKDLVLWFKYTKFPKVVVGAGDYVAMLKQRKYFESSEDLYRERLKQFLT